MVFYHKGLTNPNIPHPSVMTTTSVPSSSPLVALMKARPNSFPAVKVVWATAVLWVRTVWPNDVELPGHSKNGQALRGQINDLLLPVG
jgi:hypothetical protein